jgi:hypothetical protein
MADSLRLIEDLVPLIAAPADKAVATLKQTLGTPTASAGSRTAWPKAGLVLMPGVSAGTNTIAIYCDASDGFQPFQGSLAESLPLPEDRRDVRKSLGEPTAGRTNPRLSLNRLLGMAGVGTPQVEWDRYDNPERVIHFEYDASRRVKRITLTSAPTVSA